MKMKYESPEADVVRMASLSSLALIEDTDKSSRSGSVDSSTEVGEGAPPF